VSTQIERWEAWRSLIRSSPSGPDGIERTLEELAENVTAAIRRRPLVDRWWEAAGIRVEARPMRARGRCDTSRPGTPVVVVRSTDNRYAQGFTVAHELAHLLLDQLPVERRGELGYRSVEDLCDQFAQNVIVPPARLSVELDPAAGAPAPAEVLRMCGLFEANPSVMLRALERQLCLRDETYLLARLRGHYRRPAEVGFRVDTTAGNKRLFWPRHTRVAKLGLTKLACDGEQAPHGAHLTGRETRAVIPLARLDRSTEDNAMAGPLSWQAVRQGKSGAYLLALLDIRELSGVRAGGDADAGPRPSRPTPKTISG
jgi:Zn-dependent peptidase ImmA (M78 family)